MSEQMGNVNRKVEVLRTVGTLTLQQKLKKKMSVSCTDLKPHQLTLFACLCDVDNNDFPAQLLCKIKSAHQNTL